MQRFSDPDLGPVTVGSVPPERTYALRQSVLRPHQRIEEMSTLDPAVTGGLVVGAVAESSGEVVSTATVHPEEPPADLDGAMPPGRRWRLRGMATAPEVRGAGLGRAVLDVVLRHVASRGAGVVWCSARVPAAGFYEAAGFVRAGEEWEAEHIGRHVMMWRAVEPEGDRDQ